MDFFAAYGTYDTYQESMFDNWALMWIVRGWVSVLAATISSVLVAWGIGRIYEKNPT